MIQRIHFNKDKKVQEKYKKSTKNRMFDKQWLSDRIDRIENHKNGDNYIYKGI